MLNHEMAVNLQWAGWTQSKQPN